MCLTISWPINFPCVSFLCHCHLRMLCDKLISPLILAWGMLFLADAPCRGSYDALVLLCNVLHMAPGRGSKLWVEWCFCSTWIIPEESKQAGERTAASNKVVKMSAEARRQHTPPGSCCLPGAHLQIIYGGRRCQCISNSEQKVQSYYKKRTKKNNNDMRCVSNAGLFEVNSNEPNFKQLVHDLNV